MYKETKDKNVLGFIGLGTIRTNLLNKITSQ